MTTPQHRAPGGPPTRKRGWLGVTAAAALLATSLGGVAFAANSDGFEPEDTDVELATDVDLEVEAEEGGDLGDEQLPASPEDTEGVEEETEEQAEPAVASLRESGAVALAAEVPDGQPLSCAAGTVYGVSSGGQLQEITQGNVTKVGDPASGVSSFNGLGIGSGGQTVIAYERTNNARTANIYTFDTSEGKWTDAKKSYDTSTQANGSFNGALVAGAIDLSSVDGVFYFGGFQTEPVWGNETKPVSFKIWQYTPTTKTFAYKGYVPIVDAEAGPSNGDMAFDGSGTLYIVRGSGDTTTVYSVLPEDLAKASGGEINGAESASVTTMNNVNGVAFDADGRAYLGSGSEVRSYAMPNWSNKVDVVTKGYSSGTDLASCSSPTTIMIEKEVLGGRVNDTDQFQLTLKQGDQTLAEATTTGTATGIQAERIGPLPTTRGVELTFTESAAGTANMDDYASAYACSATFLDDDTPAGSLSEGDGTSGTVTIPENADTVKCVLRNAPLIATVNIHKDVVDTTGQNATAAAGWTVGAAATDVTGTPAAATQETNADGDASWSFKFANRHGKTTISVNEVMQDGFEFKSGSCTVTKLAGAEEPIELTGPTATELADIEPGDKVDCAYTNQQKTGAYEWTKVDAADATLLLPGSEWVLEGPGQPTAGTPFADCVADAAADCTGLDKDPAAGELLLEGLAWGTYTVTETKAPEGYEVGTPASFTFEIDADNAGTVVAGDPVKNTRVVPTLTLVKELDIQFGAPAVAGDWTLTAEAQGESTTKLEGASGVTGELEAGVYDLSEAGPAGYDLADLTCVNSDDEELATSVENPEVTLERGENVTCTFTNVDQPGDVVWEKVDDSTDAKLLAGSEWTLAGPGVPVDTVVTDCVEADCPAGAYLDQDPAAGKFKLEDLEWGTYILKETKAPEGYELDDASYEFTISGESLSADVGQVVNKAQETPGPEPKPEPKPETKPGLPTTGANGPLLLTLGGIALAAVAGGAYLVTRRKATH